MIPVRSMAVEAGAPGGGPGGGPGGAAPGRAPGRAAPTLTPSTLHTPHITPAPGGASGLAAPGAPAAIESIGTIENKMHPHLTGGDGEPVVGPDGPPGGASASNPGREPGAPGDAVPGRFGPPPSCKQTAPDSQQRLMIQHIAPDWRNYDKRPRVRVRRVLVTCASMSDTGSDFENEVAKRRARKSGGNDVDGKEAQDKYQESEQGKAERKEKRRRYRESQKGKAARKKYLASDVCKALRKKYSESPKGKDAIKKWEKRRPMRKQYLASAMRKAEQKWKAQVKKWESAKAPVKVEGVALDKDTLFKAWAYYVLDRKYNSNAQ